MTSPTPATPPLYTPWPYTPSGKAEAWVQGYVRKMVEWPAPKFVRVEKKGE